MRNGFFKVAACTPVIELADVGHNSRKVIEAIRKAQQENVKLVVFPELVLTGYTCGDLFFQSLLIDEAQSALISIAEETSDCDVLAVVTLPLSIRGKLYNCAAVLHRGRILGVVPKVNLPNYNEFYEERWFNSHDGDTEIIKIGDQDVLFSPYLLFSCSNHPGFVLGIEICEDMWTPVPKSSYLALNGATVIANPSTSNDLVGKDFYREDLIRMNSARQLSSYIYANSGWGESTTDMVFLGNDYIYSNGKKIAGSIEKYDQLISGIIDVEESVIDRRITSTFIGDGRFDSVYFTFDDVEYDLKGCIQPDVFIPSDGDECDKILNLQATGLAQRLVKAHSRTAVIGLSGGLDSTLALLVAHRAFRKLGWDMKNIICVTMPCFGTTARTKSNAQILGEKLGTSFREICIKDSVISHFDDIGQDRNNFDVTYENSQARERTQVLMDVANMENGLVVGTGDLSELALGWATYNGDQMSNYGVNASVPKTLVRSLVKHIADSDESIRDVLYDILDTPISPELIPSNEDGTIRQVTEDFVGPYRLHDFFIYYIIRKHFSPDKVLRMAQSAFMGIYDREFIKKWLGVFYRRFFTQQFKRSAMPDGPKIGSVSLSPRGDLRMPSDASFSIWKQQLENL